MDDPVGRALNPDRLTYQGKYLEDMTRLELIAALRRLAELCMGLMGDESKEIDRVG